VKLLGQSVENGRVHRDWLHYGDDGKTKLTIQIVQDVSPTLRAIEREAKAGRSKDFRLKAMVPFTMIEEAAKISAKAWGVSVKNAFSELMNQKTDRAKKALKLLTEGRDYRKLQARHYV
jgi:hypothetical protein